MKSMKNLKLVFAVFLVCCIFVPFLAIWLLNTLLMLNIAYSLFNWFVFLVGLNAVFFGMPYLDGAFRKSHSRKSHPSK